MMSKRVGSAVKSLTSKLTLAAWILPSMRARMSGPGGYYNIGNLVGLMTGVGLQVTEASRESTAAEAVVAFFIGNPSSIALTLATMVFLVSGEIYHRAWADGFPPDSRLNALGDLLSAFGALALGVGLLILGQPLMAAFSGLLHAVGKFGSAFEELGMRPILAKERFWRSVVVLSRIPAIMAATFEIAIMLFSAQGMFEITGFAAPVFLLVCYLLWLKADIMLFPKPEADGVAPLNPGAVLSASDHAFVKRSGAYN